MANGRVCTGFSNAYVATYTNASGTITYGTPTIVARGVNVSITPDTGSDTIFYADNQAAETAAGAGIFTSGSFTLEVDGLKDAARKLIYGLPTADSDGWTSFDDDQALPYLGLGFIVRYMENGVASYVPVMLAKVAFDPEPTSAATQEDTISFQTSSLSGKIFRGDDSKHTWKFIGQGYSTESAAVTALTTKMA